MYFMHPSTLNGHELSTIVDARVKFYQKINVLIYLSVVFSVAPGINKSVFNLCTISMIECMINRN